MLTAYEEHVLYLV